MASSRVGYRPQALFMSASTSRTSSSVSFTNRRGHGISVSMSAITAPHPKEKAAAAAKVDRWMRESVADIVKNLREAPLLVHLYPTPVVEKDVREETWPSRVERWGRQESPVPVGVIFVERLPSEDEEAAARAWGLVVQGAGGECGPVCYLLKTTSGGGGPGHRCTHFCLMRVQNYRESALSQLSNCWLLR